MATYYKFLNEDGTGPHSGFAWPLPTDDGPGEWARVGGDLVTCERGLHATTIDHALSWLAATCYELEYREEPIAAEDKVVGREARLLRRLNWDEREARLFAADCAERALPLYEARHPGDDRPRAAIETARRCARGEATGAELDAAASAAWAAARAAARAAESAWQAERLRRYLHGEVA